MWDARDGEEVAIFDFCSYVHIINSVSYVEV